MVAGIAGRPVTQTQQEAEGKATERNGTEQNPPQRRDTPTDRHTNRQTDQRDKQEEEKETGTQHGRKGRKRERRDDDARREEESTEAKCKAAEQS